jgi:hypothetical protein
MIYNLIKSPCTTLNNTVGDGTTTAIALTNFLYQIYNGNLDDESIPNNRKYAGAKHQFESYYRLPREFNNIWDEIITTINELVQSYAKPLSSDDYDSIYKIAYVASNGNSEISENIANTYKNSKIPVIKIKNSPTNKSYVKSILGYDININLIDSAYVRNEDLSVNEKDIATLIFDYKIDMDICNNLIFRLNDIFRYNNKKLLIIAPMYDKYLAETVLKQYVNYEYQKYKELNLILSQYSKLDSYQLNDLSVILKSRIITQDIGNKILSSLNEFDNDGNKHDFINEIIDNNEDNQSEYYELIGKADSALLSCNNGTIFESKNIENYPRYEDVLRVAEKELSDAIANTDYEKQSFAHKIMESQTRISRLKMENYIYYVGADTALEKIILEDSVDDVIKCVRSAIKSGVVPGCQLSIIKACNEIMKNIIGNEDDVVKLPKLTKLKLGILEMISDAAKNVYASVLRGPDGMGVLKLVDRWEYMTGTEESILALREATSVKESEILKESIELYKVFNLETCEFSDEVITSAETDIKILTAASQLIKILISGNQCLFLDSEVNDTHNENIEVYA